MCFFGGKFIRTYLAALLEKYIFKQANISLQKLLLRVSNRV